MVTLVSSERQLFKSYDPKVTVSIKDNELKLKRYKHGRNVPFFAAPAKKREHKASGKTFCVKFTLESEPILHQQTADKVELVKVV